MNTPLCIFIGQNPVCKYWKKTQYRLTKYQLNNNVTITSFCFVNKSGLANSLFSNKMEHLRMLRKWLSSGLHAAHCPDFIDKDSWPPNSPDMNPLDYNVWGRCCRTSVTWIRSWRTSRNLSQHLKVKIWDELLRDAICKFITYFRKRLRACVNTNGGHFEHLL